MILTVGTVLVAGVTIGAALLNRRRLENKWERVATSRLSLGTDGVTVGGGPVALGRGGRGVLILHGFGDTTQSVHGLSVTLHAHGWTVRAPLLRGHGRSIHEHARTRAADWLADARRALDQLRREADEVSIVGQSMGGALAVILAAESPPRSLVLVAPYVRMTRRGARIARFNRLLSAFVPYLQSRSDSSILDPEARRRALGSGVTTPRLVRELARTVGSAWRAAPSVTAPTLVIHSTRDHRISAKDAEAGFARLGSSSKTLKWAQRSGHVLTVDYDRDWIANEVLAWLDAHSTSGDPHR